MITLNNIDFDKVLFRSSGVSSLMTCLEPLTEKQTERLKYLLSRPEPTDIQKKEIERLLGKKNAASTLPPGAITYLEEIYADLMYDIYEDVSSREIDKGNLCEQDVLGLIGEYLGIFLIKNEKTFENDFLCGTPDAFIGGHTGIVVDVKSSWNYRTFKAVKDIPPAYFFQLLAYMWLTGAKIGLLGYGLVDTPEMLIQDEISKKSWAKGIIDEQSAEFYELEDRIRKNMTFSDRIPAKNRLKLFWIIRDEYLIKRMKERCIMGRAELKAMHQRELDYNPFQNEADLSILESEPVFDKLLTI